MLLGLDMLMVPPSRPSVVDVDSPLGYIPGAES
jgi:hypothetical protein